MVIEKEIGFRNYIPCTILKRVNRKDKVWLIILTQMVKSQLIVLPRTPNLRGIQNGGKKKRREHFVWINGLAGEDAYL